VAGTLLAAAEDADEAHRRDDRPDALQEQEAPTLVHEGDHRQHGRADQVEDQVDERVLVEQAQLTEGERGKDGHGSTEFQDNDHGVGHLTDCRLPGAGPSLIPHHSSAVPRNLAASIRHAVWYSGYAATTAPWGLDPLTDQQLAGVTMWIPAGGIYLLVALALLVAWIQATEREDVSL
jgi:Cytochrome c oxidase caa3 assembly factor (Caa3_CtaG)